MARLSYGVAILDHVTDHNNNSYTFNKLIGDQIKIIYYINLINSLVLLQTMYGIHNTHQVDPQFSCHCGFISHSVPIITVNYWCALPKMASR